MDDLIYTALVQLNKKYNFTFTKKVINYKNKLTYTNITNTEYIITSYKLKLIN